MIKLRQLWEEVNSEYPTYHTNRRERHGEVRGFKDENGHEYLVTCTWTDYDMGHGVVTSLQFFVEINKNKKKPLAAYAQKVVNTTMNIVNSYVDGHDIEQIMWESNTQNNRNYINWLTKKYPLGKFGHESNMMWYLLKK